MRHYIQPARGFTRKKSASYLLIFALLCSSLISNLVPSVSASNPDVFITRLPSNQTVDQGGSTTFTVTASNATSYQWQVDKGSGFLHVANGGKYSGATSETLTISDATVAMSGYTYRVLILGDGNPAVSVPATLTVTPAPSISSHPSNQTIDQGESTTFTVTASNATSYQWQVDEGLGFTDITNGAPYSGATTATLTITDAAAGMTGYLYRVIASSSVSLAATSNSATLTVNPAPSITGEPSNQTIDQGANAAFTVTAANATSYQWQVDEGLGFTDITNGAPYSGAITPTLTITGATTGMTGYTYRVIAGGSVSPAATSNHATLTVVPPPAAPTAVTIASGDEEVTISWDLVDGATGYIIFQSTTSGVYGAELATVGDAVFSYKVTGLTNGIPYYFVIKATNSGGDSSNSNETTAVPRTIAAAPTNITATAGNREVMVSFTAPTDNGGDAITSYEVTVSPGNIVVTGSSSPITITSLSNGTAYTFTVKAINLAGSSAASAASNAATPSVTPTSNNTPTPTPTTTILVVPEQPAVGVEVLVNGKMEKIGTVITATEAGRKVVTVTVDQKGLEKKLASESAGSVLTIPFNTQSDNVIVELNGQMMRNMEQKQMILDVKTSDITYTLPVATINIGAISDQLGSSVHLEDIIIQIEIATPNEEMLKLAEQAAANGQFAIAIPAVSFTVRATYGDKTIQVTKFDAYIERTIAIPEGIDPNKITTGIVVDPDGTIRHVPTNIVVIDGKYYAKVNSLTNSTYAIVWHPLTFKDAEQHWAKTSINDMGSRMVINGISKNLFDPDRAITRAEFTAIMVRGLGLKPVSGVTSFTDVKTTDWYSAAIQTLYEYQLINGFEDGSFHPQDTITREQAMSIISKAMLLTKLKATPTDLEAVELLKPFTDADSAAVWAKEGIAASIQAGIVSGRSSSLLAPKAQITRAEVAVIVQRLLHKAELIN